ncbi:hypothetical protein [Marivita sp. XM-24bin2]|jgi:flagellar hook-associated protein 3 FlgL|uniref:hypothetical protein n=1 Tax=Marivita sp. XM-24bin2 TaxID=2133951 RepID=UPI000D7A0C25|nr:hypothetical protein [Marivita sp. XM-24bin2]MCR9111339.1 hypothetical protein [Paracoccaceae bacterium]PWL36252.1 MAG: hypothetical protein DCO97_04615 [Marivita sp. XM-24bin2]
MRPIGDLAQFMLSKQMQSRLRTSADIAGQETTTGLTNDIAQHLGGASIAVSLLDRKMELLGQHKHGIAEARVFASASQTVLAEIQDQSSQLINSLALASQMQSASELKVLSEKAAQAMIDIVNALNSKIGGKYLFAGSDTQSKPLPDGISLVAMLRSEVSGATTVGDVRNAINTWFETSGGAFETLAYAGSDTGFLQMPIGNGESAKFGLRADGESVRGLIQALGIAAFATDSSIALGTTDQKKLLTDGYNALRQIDLSLTEERAGLGLIEASIENAKIATEMEISRIERDRLSLIGIDQFEAASKFESAQQQLDVFYRIAARQGRTSLAEYLR